MAEISTPKDVLLICGMISARIELLEQAQAELAKSLGSIELRSEVMPFDHTRYYEAEMGCPLLRQFVSFAAPVKPDALVAAKLATNAIERQFAQTAGRQPSRPINLDPGYIHQAKLVLASCKDFSHRVYLGQGVFGEVTLMYHREGWQSLPWTFPDYASGRYFKFLSAVRGRLREHLGDRTC